MTNLAIIAGTSRKNRKQEGRSFKQRADSGNKGAASKQQRARGRNENSAEAERGRQQTAGESRKQRLQSRAGRQKTTAAATTATTATTLRKHYPVPWPRQTLSICSSGTSKSGSSLHTSGIVTMHALMDNIQTPFKMTAVY